jgi:hypothetical protein
VSVATRQLRAALTLRAAVSFAQQPNTFVLAITTVPGIAMIGVKVAVASRVVEVRVSRTNPCQLSPLSMTTAIS